MIINKNEFFRRGGAVRSVPDYHSEDPGSIPGLVRDFLTC